MTRYFLLYSALFLYFSCNPKKIASESEMIDQSKMSVNQTVKRTKSVRDFGAKGDGSTDDSKAFIQAINTGYLYVPNGIYKVKNLPLLDGLTVVGESNKAIVQGVTSSDVIFKSTKFAKDITISGGTWSNAKTVVLHDSEKSLNSSSFSQMQIENCDNGFIFTSSVGNSFQNLKFSHVKYGLHFGKNGQKNVHNVNHISGCKFMYFSDYGIYFENNAQKKSKNVIENCWLEQSVGTGIYLGNNCISTVIQNTYFESLGSSNKGRDITVGASKSSSCMGTKILNNVFKRSKAGSVVPARILVQGASDLNAGGNEVNLLGAQKFVKFDNKKSMHSFLMNNQLNQIGNERQRKASKKLSGQQTLFERTAGQKVNYTLNSSDSGTESYQEFKEGQVIQKVYKLGSGATPSIRQGNIFTVPSGQVISNFTGGVDGLKVTLIATATRTIQSNTKISLDNGRPFKMAVDQSLTLIYIGNKWIETSRKN